MRAHELLNRRQSGSAYLIVLLALVVLTILGLSLSTVTSLEMEVGQNERGATRIFYSADSGIGVAVAHALTSHEYRSRQILLPVEVQLEPSGDQVSRGTQLAVSYFVPIQAAPCNLCSVNENETKFYKVNHAVVSSATELTWSGTATSPPANANVRALKAVAAMIEFQPSFEPDTRAFPTDPADVEQVSKAF
jgi:PilX N-terminal